MIETTPKPPDAQRAGGIYVCMYIFLSRYLSLSVAPMLLQTKGMLSKFVQDEDAQKMGGLASRRLSGRTWSDCQITKLAETIWPSFGPNPAVPNLAGLPAGCLAGLIAPAASPPWLKNVFLSKKKCILN